MSTSTKLACSARVGPNLTVPTGESARPAEGEALARAIGEVVQVDLVPAKAEIVDHVVILTDAGVAQCREQEGIVAALPRHPVLARSGGDDVIAAAGRNDVGSALELDHVGPGGS